MAFIEGTDRSQMMLSEMFAFEKLIAPDNPIRFIDAYVESLNLEELGFVVHSGDNPGQKPYKTSLLLKVHIYCFLNGIQSSRKQERECARNIELIWLTGNLKPDHSTIASFCKDNHFALRRIFREFVKLCRKLHLLDFKIFAIDGTKVEAFCSNQKAYSKMKITKLLDKIDKKIKEYMRKIDDEELDKRDLEAFKEKLELVKQRKIEYSEYKDKMEKEDLNELCVTDPDAKIMKNHSNIEPCYNVQSVVDSKHKLILDYDVTNQANDIGLLEPMVDKVFEEQNLDAYLKENPDHQITILADTGYYKAEDMLNINSRDNVKALVPKAKSSNSTGETEFSKDNFEYDNTEDIYICPAKRKLIFSRKSKETRNGKTTTYKIYTCTSCSDCEHFGKCTNSKKGRSIKRHPHEDKLEAFEKEYKKDSSAYCLRKALVEHPFGTIKRALGFRHVYVKGKERVSSWAASVCLAYDLKRVINILGTKELITQLEAIKAT